MGHVTYNHIVHDIIILYSGNLPQDIIMETIAGINASPEEVQLGELIVKNSALRCALQRTMQPKVEEYSA